MNMFAVSFNVAIIKRNFSACFVTMRPQYACCGVEHTLNVYGGCVLTKGGVTLGDFVH